MELRCPILANRTAPDRMMSTIHVSTGHSPVGFPLNRWNPPGTHETTKYQRVVSHGTKMSRNDFTFGSERLPIFCVSDRRLLSLASLCTIVVNRRPVIAENPSRRPRSVCSSQINQIRTIVGNDSGVPARQEWKLRPNAGARQNDAPISELTTARRRSSLCRARHC